MENELRFAQGCLDLITDRYQWKAIVHEAKDSLEFQ